MDRETDQNVAVDSYLEPDHAGVTELESLESPLKIIGAGDLLEAGEDDGVGGAAALVQQLDAVHVVAADGAQVPREDPELRPIRGEHRPGSANHSSPGCPPPARS